MKVWFCRDDDGISSVWPEENGPLFVMGDNGRWWCDGPEAYYDPIVDDTWDNEDDEVSKMFGPGYHGVRKGRKKLLDLEVIS